MNDRQLNDKLLDLVVVMAEQIRQFQVLRDEAGPLTWDVACETQDWADLLTELEFHLDKYV
ncbi:MAG: hypothetical protein ACO20M_06050 [Methylophilaceae bacterium]